MTDFFNDKDTAIEPRTAAADAALAYGNAVAAVAYYRLTGRTPTQNLINRMNHAKSVLDSAAHDMADAYGGALVTTQDSATKVDVQIPRRDRGTSRDPAMEAYHMG